MKTCYYSKYSHLHQLFIILGNFTKPQKIIVSSLKTMCLIRRHRTGCEREGNQRKFAGVFQSTTLNNSILTALILIKGLACSLVIYIDNRHVSLAIKRPF